MQAVLCQMATHATSNTIQAIYQNAINFLSIISKHSIMGLYTYVHYVFLLSVKRASSLILSNLVEKPNSYSIWDKIAVLPYASFEIKYIEPSPESRLHTSISSSSIYWLGNHSFLVLSLCMNLRCLDDTYIQALQDMWNHGTLL